MRSRFVRGLAVAAGLLTFASGCSGDSKSSEETKADPFQETALQDDKVTFGEYAAAVYSTITCVTKALPNVAINGPRASNDRRRLDWTYRLPFSNEAESEQSADDLQRATDTCSRRFLDGVQDAYEKAAEPRSGPDAAASAALRQCLADLGINIETPSLSALTKVPFDSNAGARECLVRLGDGITDG